MTTQFHRHLLSELHMVVCRKGDPALLNDRLLCEAVTVNENLRSLGYCLRPADIVRLAISPSLHSFYEDVKELVPDVKAQPMYPGFPQQVMALTEAEFRFHQALHYFSTYNVELLTSAGVSRGWLPDYDGPARTERDTRLLEASVVELVSADDAAITALKTLLARRERLTNPELELVLESAAACTAEQMQGLKVRFKENLELLFPMLMETADRDTALRTLRAICAHSGDVLRCCAEYLRSRKYHLRTSEKRLLVKLLESYPVGNLRLNLMQSNALRERNLLVLQHLDYNMYSRSAEHREAVRALRNGELLSWHGIGESLLAAHSPEALTHLAQRPGYMLRMLNRLLSLEYAQEAILDALLPRAADLSAHLILKVLRTLACRKDALEEQHQADVAACNSKHQQDLFRHGLFGIEAHYSSRRDACRGKAWRDRVQAEEQYLNCPRREAQQAASDTVREAREAVARKESALKLMLQALKKAEAHPSASDHRLIGNANNALDGELIWCLFDPAHFRNAAARCEEELAPLRTQLKQLSAEADRHLQARLRAIEAENRPLYERELQRINQREQVQLSAIEADYQRELANVSEAVRALVDRQAIEMAALDARYRQQLNMLRYDPPATQLLKALLREHFRRATTVLKGKRVFCGLEQFDLAHSSLETEDRSRDGGYIRSGIAWRIPEEARYVRFFTYWNDPSRVDVDLHVGGIDLDGKSLHVGWNGDYSKGGVVHSGDITHSDAAEYIDIDLSAPIREIYANVNLYYGKYSFKGIQTCYVGMMAVDSLGAEVRHYDPANCFFTHALTQNTRNLFYGCVDVQNRCVRFVGQPNPGGWAERPRLESPESMFSLKDYLDCVLEGQAVEPVESADEAELVLTMGKSLLDNGISLVDNNFFLES